jgi:hypothetical protein
MESINSWGLNDEFTGLAKSGMDACKVFVEFNYLTTSDHALFLNLFILFNVMFL